MEIIIPVVSHPIRSKILLTYYFLANQSFSGELKGWQLLKGTEDEFARTSFV